VSPSSGTRRTGKVAYGRDHSRPTEHIQAPQNGRSGSAHIPVNSDRMGSRRPPAASRNSVTSGIPQAHRTPPRRTWRKNPFGRSARSQCYGEGHSRPRPDAFQAQYAAGSWTAPVLDHLQMDW